MLTLVFTTTRNQANTTEMSGADPDHETETESGTTGGVTEVGQKTGVTETEIEGIATRGIAMTGEIETVGMARGAEVGRDRARKEAWHRSPVLRTVY